MDLEQIEPIVDNDSGYQLRVRVSKQQRDAMEKVRVERGETTSDFVRAALALFLEQHEGTAPCTILESKVRTLAGLLKRDPAQVQKACIEGIFDLIEDKAKIPLIVMESQLHKSYRDPESNRTLS